MPTPVPTTILSALKTALAADHSAGDGNTDLSGADQVFYGDVIAPHANVAFAVGIAGRVGKHSGLDANVGYFRCVYTVDLMCWARGATDTPESRFTQ